MRDIKEIRFRVWVKFLQEMQNVQCLNMGSSVITDGYDYPIEADAVYLMQYTGVKDANAVDIYEGDIVRCSNEYRTVKMWMGNACLCLDDPTGVPIYPYNVNGHVEVIGNIYENPELLNEEIQND